MSRTEPACILSSTSPAVDVGVPLAGVVAFDYEGVSRLGVPYDLGAFVAGAASTSGAALPGGR
ncbi:choice-of-anchor Q domain-containing protein [Myxococcus eversor]|uniref:choice-of-anchor Q domain-containing protein n=1 Tax=Myxococcus eversor TaxID=2709661 RepID=UPI0030845150